jgi:hypothetical protein
VWDVAGLRTELDRHVARQGKRLEKAVGRVEKSREVGSFEGLSTSGLEEEVHGATERLDHLRKVQSLVSAAAEVAPSFNLFSKGLSHGCRVGIFDEQPVVAMRSVR